MVNMRTVGGFSLVERTPKQVKHTVLLLPGLQGSDLVFETLMTEKLLGDSGVRLLAGNPPGFKGNAVPTGFDFSVASYAQLVEGLAAEEGVDLIVGHSFGGNVLIEVAARGSFGGKLMLISPALDREAESKDLKTLDSMSRKPVLRGIMWWLTYAMMTSVFKPYFDDQELLKRVTAEAKLIPRHVGRRILLGYFDHLDKHGDLAARLVTTKAPVSYVRGDKDDIGFTDAHRQTLDGCDEISLHEIPGARHFAMVDKPADVAELIVAALGSHAANGHAT